MTPHIDVKLTIICQQSYVICQQKGFGVLDPPRYIEK